MHVCGFRLPSFLAKALCFASGFSPIPSLPPSLPPSLSEYVPNLTQSRLVNPPAGWQPRGKNKEVRLFQEGAQTIIGFNFKVRAYCAEISLFPLFLPSSFPSSFLSMNS